MKFDLPSGVDVGIKGKIMYGLIGKKVKMTQIFNDNGHVVPVTLVEAGPCTVSQIKEEENN